MRVVLDTNILARATDKASGPARQVLRLLQNSSHVLILSLEILDELKRVLAYPRLQALVRLDEQDLKTYVTQLLTHAELVTPSPLPVRVCADQADDVIIATAVAGHANFLCTFDQHLRETTVVDYCLGQGFDVLSDVQLVRNLRSHETTDGTRRAA